MLLAIDVDVIFFLLVAVIGLLNQLFQKVRKVRAESVRQQKLRENSDRIESPREQEAKRESRPHSMRAVMDDIKDAAEDAAAALAGSAASPPPPPRSGDAAASPRKRRRIPLPLKATTKTPSAPLFTSRASAGGALGIRLREDPSAFREAIVLREVLGPPVAHRGPLTRKTR